MKRSFNSELDELLKDRLDSSSLGLFAPGKMSFILTPSHCRPGIRAWAS